MDYKKLQLLRFFPFGTIDQVVTLYILKKTSHICLVKHIFSTNCNSSGGKKAFMCNLNADIVVWQMRQWDVMDLADMHY